MSSKLENHPVYGYLTKDEYQEMMRCGAESTKYYKDLHEKRKREAKKKKGK